MASAEKSGFKPLMPLQTNRYTQTDRDTQAGTYTYIGTQADTHRHRQTDTHTQIHILTETHTHISERHTDIQMSQALVWPHGLLEDVFW